MTKFTRILVSIFLVFSQLNNVYAVEELTWTNCIGEAAKNNPDLVVSLEAANQKKAARQVTASGLYPQATGAMSAQRTGTGLGNSGTTVNSFSYGVSGTQLIYDGGKTINSYNSASEAYKAAREGYVFSSSNVRLNLRSAFVNLLKAQENIKVTEDIVKIRKDNCDLISLRYKSGLEHKGAFLTAEANLLQAQFDLSQAQRNIELYQRHLTKQLGRQDFMPILVTGDFLVNEPAFEKPDFEGIAKNNPQVLQAEANAKSAKYNLESTYGNFAPTINGSIGVDRTSSNWPPRGTGWDMGLSLSMPIFEGGLRAAQVLQARAAYKQAKAQEKSTRYTVIVNLIQAWTALQDAIENVNVQKKSLEANIERSNIAQAQYSTGFITFDNWIIIENDLVNAKKTFLNAQANALLAEASWIQAKGETLEYANQ